MRTIDELIREGETFTSLIATKPIPSGVIRVGRTFIIKDDKAEAYNAWKQYTLMFLRKYSDSRNADDFEKMTHGINPENHSKMISFLKNQKDFLEPLSSEGHMSPQK
ncbi:hypothetical protein [Bacteroides hominis]|nr:hypothetical protein DXB60_15750 [Bacteroides fragilis]